MKMYGLSKSVQYLIISTICIMAFAKGNFGDWLLIGNCAVWLVLKGIRLARQYANRENPVTPDTANKEDDSTDPEILPDPAENNDMENWYQFFGRELLTDLITDLNTRGIRRLEMDAAGEIRISETETEHLSHFPKNGILNTLVDELVNDGLDASTDQGHLVIAW